MNLNLVPARTADEVEALVKTAVRNMAGSDFVEGLQTFLIKPRLEKRWWDYAKPYAEYPIWVIAESTRYDYGIAFYDYGFAPECPWGLIFISHKNFNADYCWYATLENAYKDSRLLEEYQESGMKGC